MIEAPLLLRLQAAHALHGHAELVQLVGRVEDPVVVVARL